MIRRRSIRIRRRRSSTTTVTSTSNSRRRPVARLLSDGGDDGGDDVGVDSSNGGFSSILSALSVSSDDDLSLSSSSHHHHRHYQNPMPLLPSRRKTNCTKHWTINKLDLDKVGLYGRDAEIVVLANTLERMQQSKRKQLVFISGYSGTGKTRLVTETLRQHSRSAAATTATSPLVVVKGKFNLTAKKEPLTGIAAACCDIIKYLVSLKTSNQTLFREIQTNLTLELAQEMPLLARVIPELHQLLETSEATTTESQSQQAIRQISSSQSLSSIVNNPNQQVPAAAAAAAAEDPSDTRHRFNHAFRRFMRTVGKHLESSLFIMILDDLQWADVSSIELLENILLDRENGNLMLVGIYRSNEVGGTHVLVNALRELESHAADSSQTYLDITKLEIGNLDMEAVKALIVDVLSCRDSSKIEGLAAICLRQTHGNAFFLLEFLSMLHRKSLLEFNLGLLEWRWNETEIEQQTQATDNVVDLLKSRMNGLSESQTLLLRIAACLGAKFDQYSLLLVWTETCKESTKESN